MMARTTNASVTAGTVVERGKDLTNREVLFVIWKDGVFGIPAGHLQDETPRQCAVREFMEETGYRVTLDGLLKVVTIASPREKGGAPSIGFIFHGALGEKVSEGELEMRWVNSTEFIQILSKGLVFLPQFHIPAFWAFLDFKAPIDIVFDDTL